MRAYVAGFAGRGEADGSGNVQKRVRAISAALEGSDDVYEYGVRRCSRADIGSKFTDGPGSCKTYLNLY
jgi:hypothetical protein